MFFALHIQINDFLIRLQVLHQVNKRGYNSTQDSIQRICFLMERVSSKLVTHSVPCPALPPVINQSDA